MPGGRPLKFKNKSTLAKAIARYFRECDPHIKKVDCLVDLKDGTQEVVEKQIMTEQVPYTITGLALALNTSRETLLDYENKQGYSDTIKEAKQKCENYAEKRLFSGSQVAGSIFNLKNNYKGWKEKREIAIGGLKSLLDEVYEGKQSNIKSESGNPEPVDRKDEGQTL